MKPEPTPASCSTVTSWPRWTSSSAPAGVRATRYSRCLISLATPIRIAAGRYRNGRAASVHLPPASTRCPDGPSRRRRRARPPQRLSTGDASERHVARTATTARPPGANRPQRAHVRARGSLPEGDTLRAESVTFFPQAARRRGRLGEALGRAARRRRGVPRAAARRGRTAAPSRRRRSRPLGPASTSPGSAGRRADRRDTT